MLENETRHPFWKALGIILATLLGAFLAFYFVVDLTFSRMMNPDYQIKKMERAMEREARHFRKIDAKLNEKFLENPFEPKMAPMLVNLVKEADEYKVIVDLKPLGGDEKNVNVKLDGNVVSVSGDIEKRENHGEKILNFSQSYYLDENLQTDKISKERKGNKYIITIPFND